MTTFSFWLAISEALDTSSSPRMQYGRSPVDPRKEVERQLSDVEKNYKPGPWPQNFTHLAAAVTGKKPVALIQYSGTSGHPALMAQRDPKRNPAKDHLNFGLVQKMMLQHGMKRRPDFTIQPINIPGFMDGWLAVGGEKEVREIYELLKLQRYMDIMSHPENASWMQVKDAVRAMRKYRDAEVCKVGEAGSCCLPLHQRIGQLLGYTDQQVTDFLHSLGSDGRECIPDIPYPGSLPDVLRNAPRRSY